jgi:predicted Zn-dependent protease
MVKGRIMGSEFQVSRRRFLRQAALTGVGIATVPLLSQSAYAGGFLGNFFGTDTLSPKDQKKMGDQATQQLLKQYKEVHDARASHFNDIGQRLVAALPEKDRQTWDFRFHVLDDKEVNAFALPGGNMFLFTGLYDKMTTDDALAAVTGHEMTHVRKEHWAKRYAQEQKRGLLLTLGVVLLHGGELVQSAAGLYDNVTDLKYSRGEEDIADQGGLQDMVAAGFNPEGMVQLFETLQRVSGNGDGPSFLSDHPLTSDRIARTRQRIALLEKDHTFPPLTPLDYQSLVGHPAS